MFYIQVSCPRRVDCETCESTLSAAIEQAYPLETEDAYLNWHGVRVALSYKYDVSVIIEDVAEMLEALAAPVGELTIVWPSDTFRTDWLLTWSDGLLHCTTTWETLTGGAESLLNDAKPIKMPVADFVAEWAEIVRLVEQDLRAAGYDDMLSGLDRLTTLAARSRRGYLYRTVEP